MLEYVQQSQKSGIHVSYKSMHCTSKTDLNTINKHAAKQNSKLFLPDQHSSVGKQPELQKKKLFTHTNTAESIF